jgi:hypothetical protein
LTEQWLEQNTAPGDRVLLQQRWLELDPQRYDLNRHAFLDRVLDGGRYELAANDWIVVHEQLLGHDALGNLQRVQTIALDPSFFGNQGPNFAVFTPPRVRPIEVPLEVSLDDPAAAPYLGHQWPGRRTREAGRLLPDDGAGLFLPPLGGRSLRLDIIVAAPSAGDAPPAIGVYSGRRDLEPRPLPATVEGTLTFSADLPLAIVGPRVVGLYIRAREGSGPVRLLGFRVY